MRLPLIPPSDLTPQQKSLYDEMRKGIASNFNAFKVEREDGALMGPWNLWLHEPAIGKAIWDQVRRVLRPAQAVESGKNEQAYKARLMGPS